MPRKRVEAKNYAPMKLELVSFSQCPYVHRATIMLREKGVPYDIRYIELSNKPDWFLAISPRGKVPVLTADGRHIFESAVINEFLDETHAPRILPEDPFERARQRAWVEVTNDHLLAQYKLGLAMTDGEVTSARDTLNVVLARFEAEIRGDFFAGDRLGIVDVSAAPALHRARILDRRFGTQILLPFPKVAAWAERLSARPSVTGGVVPDFEAEFVEAIRKKGGVLAKLLR